MKVITYRMLHILDGSSRLYVIMTFLDERMD